MLFTVAFWPNDESDLIEMIEERLSLYDVKETQYHRRDLKKTKKVRRFWKSLRTEDPRFNILLQCGRLLHSCWRGVHIGEARCRAVGGMWQSSRTFASSVFPDKLAQLFQMGQRLKRLELENILEEEACFFGVL